MLLRRRDETPLRAGLPFVPQTQFPAKKSGFPPEPSMREKRCPEILAAVLPAESLPRTSVPAAAAAGKAEKTPEVRRYSGICSGGAAAFPAPRSAHPFDGRVPEPFGFHPEPFAPEALRPPAERFSEPGKQGKRPGLIPAAAHRMASLPEGFPPFSGQVWARPEARKCFPAGHEPETSLSQAAHAARDLPGQPHGPVFSFPGKRRWTPAESLSPFEERRAAPEKRERALLSLRLGKLSCFPLRIPWAAALFQRLSPEILFSLGRFPD